MSNQRKSSWLSSIVIGVLICLGAGLIGVLFAIYQDGRPAQSLPEKSPEEIYEAEKARVLRQVKVVEWSGLKAGFGNVLEASVSVTNGSEYAVKDIVLNCELFGNSGTRIGRNEQTVYEILNAGEAKTFKGVNMGFINNQATQATVEIDDLVLLGKD